MSDEVSVNNRNGLFKELKNSLVFLLDSLRGRYSLDQYLVELGEFTDVQIINMRGAKFQFVRGHVFFHAEKGTSDIFAKIELYYQNIEGEWKKEEAARMLKKNMFTSEAIKQFEESEDLLFEIEAPDR